MVKSYIIAADRESWVLRLFGQHDAMTSSPTLESAKEQAFERVRQWAPCRILVLGDVFEEWHLERHDGGWAQQEGGSDDR